MSFKSIPIGAVKINVVKETWPPAHMSAVVTVRAANLNETVKRCGGQPVSLGRSTKNN